jgi:TonB family protein
MKHGLKRHISIVFTIVALSGGTAVRGWAQQEGQQVPVSMGKQAVSVVLKHYALKSQAVDLKTGQPLPLAGSWSIGKLPPAACPQTKEACLEVFYQVPAESARCSWVVLLNDDGTDGKFLDENDDTERFMRLKISQSEAKALVNTRKKPTFPQIAMMAHVSGAVVTEVLVGKSGEVQNVKVVSGPPMELQASADAAREWSFKPMMVGARAVPYEVQLVFTFRTTGPPYATVEVAP